MISTKKATFRELKGEFKATVVNVEAKPNMFYEDDKEKNPEEVLEITFQLEDPETLDVIMHTEKFISPVTGGKGLFQQLLDAKGLEPDENGTVDELKLENTEFVATMGQNKKGYNTILKVEKKTNDDEPDFLNT